jgi:hypothetical protein
VRGVAVDRGSDETACRAEVERSGKVVPDVCRADDAERDAAAAHITGVLRPVDTAAMVEGSFVKADRAGLGVDRVPVGDRAVRAVPGRQVRCGDERPPAMAGSVVSADPLRLAMRAYLARFKSISREHTCLDLNTFVIWCAERGVRPLAARRADLELFVRWMQETRRFMPSTVARRTSV